MYSAYLNLRPANSLVNVFATATAPSFSFIHGSQGIHKREGELLLKARVRSQHLCRTFITQRNGVIFMSVAVTFTCPIEDQRHAFIDTVNFQGSQLSNILAGRFYLNLVSAFKRRVGETLICKFDGLVEKSLTSCSPGPHYIYIFF